LGFTRENSKLAQEIQVDSSGRVQINGASGTYVANIADASNAFLGFKSGSNSVALVGQDSNGDAYLQNNHNATLRFGTNNAERARIDSSGNLLVGKTTVNNAVTGVEIVPSGGNPYIILSATASTNSSNGYHMFSTGAGAYRFYVGYGGTIFATSTSISAISDQSLKENIRDLDTGLTQVMALRPRRFDWKEETEISEKNVAGFIAQEVEQVLPELVYDYQYNADETKKSLKMGDILPTLVKAIQEQQAMIEELKARVAALEA
jgi:hypothetical protein